LIRPRAIPKSSHSTEAFSTISSWLEECLKEHPQCKSKDDILPTRLISIDQSTSETRLVVSDGSLGEWVVLSHCWGTNRHGITTTSNIEARQEVLDLETLPQMFRDAVEITRKLGFQYLWIDSLCIIQDSRLDWQLESMKMDQYFMGASLNISASASLATDATKGIFFTADEGRENFHPFAAMPAHSTSTAAEGTIYFRRTNTSGRKQPNVPPSKGKDSPLRRRAWVLQESQLSPRILWCDSKSIGWDCAVAMKSELEQRESAILSVMATKFLHRPVTDGKVDGLRQRHDALGWWYGTVNDYMTREIKFQSDRVPALAGLAKAFASRTGFQYICGLWKEDLPRGLFWNACRSKVSTEGAELRKGPPSWSWVSLPTLDTKLAIFAEEERDIAYDSELVRFNATNVNGNTYGLIESASLTLRSRWQRCADLEEPYFNTRDNCKILFPQDVGERRETYEERCRLEENQHHIGVVATLDAPEGDSLNPEAIYLQLGKQKRRPAIWHKYGEEPLWVFQALILELVEGEVEEYRRVGIAEIRVDLAEGDGWNVKAFTII
jgi:hypothetical protein